MNSTGLLWKLPDASAYSTATGNPGRLLKVVPPIGNATGAVRPTGCPTATAIPDCYATTFSYFPPGDAGKPFARTFFSALGLNVGCSN